MVYPALSSAIDGPEIKYLPMTVRSNIVVSNLWTGLIFGFLFQVCINVITAN